MPAVRSKRFTEINAKIDSHKQYPIDEAVALVKENASAKFDETVDLAIKLAIDSRQSDQAVRGSLSLPNGTGKSIRVIAFAEGAEADLARENGAVEVGGQDLVKKILGGWMDFDLAIAHPTMMRFVGQLGKVLGPKGLMPSPKSGTVTDKAGQAVADFASGKIEFRNDKEGNVHLVVGKASFTPEQLAGNVRAALKHIESARPSSIKAEYMSNVSISSTMGPGLKLEIEE